MDAETIYEEITTFIEGLGLHIPVAVDDKLGEVCQGIADLHTEEQAEKGL